MNTTLFAKWTAHRAGIILSGEITRPRLYNTYAAFCFSLDQNPDPYDAVKDHLANDIYSIKLWWGGVVPHIGQSVLGRYTTPEMDALCQSI